MLLRGMEVPTDQRKKDELYGLGQCLEIQPVSLGLGFEILSYAVLRICITQIRDRTNVGRRGLHWWIGYQKLRLAQGLALAWTMGSCFYSEVEYFSFTSRQCTTRPIFYYCVLNIWPISTWKSNIDVAYQQMT